MDDLASHRTDQQRQETPNRGIHVLRDESAFDHGLRDPQVFVACFVLRKHGNLDSEKSVAACQISGDELCSLFALRETFSFCRISAERFNRHPASLQ